MFTDIDYKHPDVQDEMKRWISWFINETGVDGLRLDAIKHINDWFIRDFMHHVRGEFGRIYAVGEYSYYDGMDIEEYLHNVEHQIDLFDVALHYNLNNARRMALGTTCVNYLTTPSWQRIRDTR